MQHCPKGLRKDLAKLSQAVLSGRVRRKELIYTRLGRLAERWPSAWSYLKDVTLKTDTELVWRWDRKKLRNAWFREGAYLLRTNLQEQDPEKLWRQYMPLTEVEAVFRTLKSELNLGPIFHRIQSRVEAHILIAFLGYCLWICLKQKLRSLGGSLTPAQVLHTLKQILMVEVWFDLRRGGDLSSIVSAGLYLSNHHPESIAINVDLWGQPERICAIADPQPQLLTRITS